MADILQMHVQINHPQAGKTESYFLETTNKATAAQLARDFINIRKRLFARSVAVVGATITTWGPPPDSTGVQLQYPIFNTDNALTELSALPGSNGNTGGTNVLPDGTQADDVAVNQPKNCFSVRYKAENGARGDRYMAFIPDSYLCGGKFAVDLPGVLVAGGTMPSTTDASLDIPQRALKAVIQWTLNNTSHGFYPFNPRAIKSVSNAIGAEIKTKTKHGIPPATKVVISGVIGANVNGVWLPTIVDDFTFTIPNTVLPGVYVTGGKISAERSTLALEAWSSAYVVRPTGKDVGRPLSPFRGRRSAKRAS